MTPWIKVQQSGFYPHPPPAALDNLLARFYGDLNGPFPPDAAFGPSWERGGNRRGCPAGSSQETLSEGSRGKGERICEN